MMARSPAEPGDWIGRVSLWLPGEARAVLFVSLLIQWRLVDMNSALKPAAAYHLC
jgi:hypothetical protein